MKNLILADPYNNAYGLEPLKTLIFSFPIIDIMLNRAFLLPFLTLLCCSVVAQEDDDFAKQLVAAGVVEENYNMGALKVEKVKEGEYTVKGIIASTTTLPEAAAYVLMNMGLFYIADLKEQKSAAPGHISVSFQVQTKEPFRSKSFLLIRMKHE